MAGVRSLACVEYQAASVTCVHLVPLVQLQYPGVPGTSLFRGTLLNCDTVEHEM